VGRAAGFAGAGYLGIIGFAITVIWFYFSDIFDKLDARWADRLGILFLAGGWALEKTRRRIVAAWETWMFSNRVEERYENFENLIVLLVIQLALVSSITAKYFTSALPAAVWTRTAATIPIW